MEIKRNVFEKDYEKIYIKNKNKNEIKNEMEIPKFIIMVPLTLLVINYSCAFIERFFPKIYALFMGNRVKRIK